MKSIPQNAIVIPLPYDGKRSFSNEEWSQIKAVMKRDKVDLKTAIESTGVKNNG